MDIAESPSGSPTAHGEMWIRYETEIVVIWLSENYWDP